MRRRTADLVSALIVALWIGLLLRGLAPAYRMMNANDLLTPVSNMIGLAVAGAIVGAALYGGGLVVALLAGSEVARFWAVGIGLATSLFGASLVTGGLTAHMLSSPWSATYFLAACVGGPVLVMVGLLGGLSFDSWLPRRRRGGPGGDGGGPSAGPAGSPPPPVAPSAAPSSVPALASPAAASAGDYWVQGTVSRPRIASGLPADHPAPSTVSSTAQAPFWEDLGLGGWLAFTALAGVVGLGAVWMGGRWHRGEHPVLGLALVAAALVVGGWWDLRRRRR